MMVLVSRLVAVLVVGTLLVACAGAGAATPTPTANPAVITAEPALIVADAIVVPARYVDVTFDTGGVVAEILVQQGDVVPQGAPLARLDTTDLHLLVAQSKANLAQAQASYDKIVAGATEEQIAAQVALVRNAEANLTRVRTGNTTPADIAGAQAQLRSAQARLGALKNPSPDNVSAARVRVQQAETELESIRTSTSATKTNAELAMLQATNSLTKAQAAYATAKSNWDFVRETGQDPTNPESTDPTTGEERKNNLNDVQERQYFEAFIQAEAALASAEKAVTQAQVTFDKSREDEVLQIQRAEATLADAREQLNGLLNPSANDIIQAEASVEQARASLPKTQQGGTTADVAVAEASVDQARANLDQLTVPARAVDLAEAQGRVEAARVALQQAERDFEQATLRAPFAGTIAERNLEIGQRVSSGTNASNTGPAPFVLADYQQWEIETSNLSERDIVRFATGARAA